MLNITVAGGTNAGRKRPLAEPAQPWQCQAGHKNPGHAATCLHRWLRRATTLKRANYSSFMRPRVHIYPVSYGPYSFYVAPFLCWYRWRWKIGPIWMYTTTDPDPK